MIQLLYPHHKYYLSVIGRIAFMISRKDNKGRKLRDNENLRADGRYCYRYTDIKTGKRKYLYANDLPDLRQKEKEIAKDREDGIRTDVSIKKLTLNELFETYMDTKQLAKSTYVNYKNMWNNRVKDEIGCMKVVSIVPSDVKKYYVQLSKQGYSHSLIKNIHNLIFPTLEMAVDDDIIRKNPSKNALSSDYGVEMKEKFVLTKEQQEKFFEYLKKSCVYNVYIPMFTIFLELGLRCGELIGLTWNDVDMDNKQISINHQLIYKNYGDGCKFHISSPKTNAGNRNIPMSETVLKAFKEQRKLNFTLGRHYDYDIDGRDDFIFITKTNRPYMPAGINNVLYNIVKAYNKYETIMAESECREPVLLPKFSAHVLRHTACTRMAEKGIDIKVLQYLMGHSSIDITMEVYNHIDYTRVQKEINKLDKVVDF